MENNNNKINEQINEQQPKKRKNPITWFKGLKKPTKIVLCSALGVGLVSAIVFPILANTVWKKNDGITLVYVESSGVYSTNGYVNIAKGQSYTFSADISKLRKKTGGCCILMSDGAEEHGTQTFKYVSEVTIKSNKTAAFTRVNELEKEADPKHKYAMKEDENNSNIEIGDGSFLDDEKILTCTFKAKISAKIIIGIMEE